LKQSVSIALLVGLVQQEAVVVEAEDLLWELGA